MSKSGRTWAVWALKEGVLVGLHETQDGDELKPLKPDATEFADYKAACEAAKRVGGYVGEIIAKLPERPKSGAKAKRGAKGGGGERPK